MTILDDILQRKRGEVEIAKQRIAATELASEAGSCTEPLRGFRQALIESPRPRVIAEIKRRSPSRGEIRADFDPVACAKAYAEGGAAAISVLTDAEGFGGDLAFLAAVRRSVELPLLRKDFVVDAYQVDEARVAGADAILLIVGAFSGENRLVELTRLRERAQALGLDVLVEVHDAAEMEIAIESGANLIGVNNRNLATFEVDLAASERLAGKVPEGVVLVAESGIGEPADIARLEASGSQAFLVGESLMREPDMTAALRRLRRTT